MATQTITLAVLGMHCNSCTRRVERALQGVRGVQAVRVSLPANQAEVDFDPAQADGSKLREAAREAVRKLGFQVPV